METETKLSYRPRISKDLDPSMFEELKKNMYTSLKDEKKMGKSVNLLKKYIRFYLKDPEAVVKLKKEGPKLKEWNFYAEYKNPLELLDGKKTTTKKLSFNWSVYIYADMKTFFHYKYKEMGKEKEKA